MEIEAALYSHGIPAYFPDVVTSETESLSDKVSAADKRNRLDLRDSHVRRALELGATIAINCDAHRIEQFDLLHYGLATAQRGWATAEKVINTWPVEKFLAFLQEKQA